MPLDTSPGPIMAEVVESARLLDETGKELRDAIEQEAEARLQYDREVERAKLEVYHEAKKMGERPPAEDIRTAIAHGKAEDAYARQLRAKAKVESLKALQMLNQGIDLSQANAALHAQSGKSVRYSVHAKTRSWQELIA